MNWRAILLSGMLAAGVSLSFVQTAAAKHWDRYYDEDCDRRGDYRDTSYGRYGGQCAQIYQRIDLDRSKIEEIGPTGRHRKALQWYRDDLRNAERDLDNCRYRGADAYRTDRVYDPSYGSGSYDDPSYDDAANDRPFEWKRDWPVLLGTVINGNIGF